MPIAETVYKILWENVDPAEGFKQIEEVLVWKMAFKFLGLKGEDFQARADKMMWQVASWSCC